jgi:sulfide:quinone oxidoreductase
LDSGSIVIAVLGEPYKCPPAPFEGAFLLHDYLEERGMGRSAKIHVTGPMEAPVPIAREVSQTILQGMSDRSISFLPRKLVTRLDNERKLAEFGDGETLHHDLFIGIPVHRVPAVVEASGLAVDG